MIKYSSKLEAAAARSALDGSSIGACLLIAKIPESLSEIEELEAKAVVFPVLKKKPKASSS